jgi:DNA-binding SARP family transcriptional activator
MGRPEGGLSTAVAVSFGVLGAVEAQVDGRSVGLGGAKQRGLLAALVWRAGRTVSASQLIEDLWGIDSPPTARTMVQGLVSRLRTELVEAGGDPAVIETRPQGYCLTASADAIDLRRAEAAAAAGRAVMGTDGAAASAQLTAALAIWRGEPLLDIEMLPLFRAMRPGLDELRRAILADRIEADLAAGQHRKVIGELRALVADEPLNEQPRGQLMRALYGAGRQVEALEQFRDLRCRLHDELGLEPGQDLRRIEQAILSHDTTIAVAQVSTARSAAVQSHAAPDGPDAPGPRGERPADPNPLSRHVRHIAAGVVVVGLVGAAAGVGLWALDRSPASSPADSSRGVAVASNSVAVVDASSLRVVADVPVGAEPGPIAVTHGDLWVGNVGDNTLTEVAVPTFRPVQTLGLPRGPVATTAATGHVWIDGGFSGTLSRVNLAGDELVGPFSPAAGETGLLAIAADGDDLWVGLPDSSLLRMDADNLQVRSVGKVPGRVKVVAALGSQVWTIQFGNHQLDQIDATTGRVRRSVEIGGQPQAIAIGDGSVWVATAAPDRLWRVSLAGHIESSVHLAAAPTAVVASGSGIWVAEGAEGRLVRLGAGNATVPVTVGIGRSIGGLALDGDRVLVTVDPR